VHTKTAGSDSTKIQGDFLGIKTHVLWKEGSRQRDGKNQQHKFLKTILVAFALSHILHPKSHHILRWHLVEQPWSILNAPIFGIHVNQVYVPPQRHLNPTPFQQSTHVAHLPSWNATMLTKNCFLITYHPSFTVCWWVLVHFDPTSKPITFYTKRTPRRGGKQQPHQTLKKSKKYKGGKKHHTIVTQSSPKIPKWHHYARKAIEHAIDRQFC
jgi:hypothetical protein